jgi:hypothetical protein
MQWRFQTLAKSMALEGKRLQKERHKAVAEEQFECGYVRVDAFQRGSEFETGHKSPRQSLVVKFQSENVRGAE